MHTNFRQKIRSVDTRMTIQWIFKKQNVPWIHLPQDGV